MALLPPAVVLLAVLRGAHAWWDIPHMLTAEVARRSLTDVARREADALLGTLASAYPDCSTFVTSAVWADVLKKDSILAFDKWHYIDFPFADGVPTCPEPDQPNAWFALNRTFATLADTSRSPWDRGLALRFIIHIMGDSHQPLHCASRCSPANQTGDQGGNLFPIIDPPRRNLHMYWDSAAGSYDALDQRIRAAGVQVASPAAEPFLREAVDELLRQVPPQSLAPLAPGGTWRDVKQPPSELYPVVFAESLHLAKTHVYNLTAGTTVPPAYAQASRAIAQQRIVLGGVRLAAVLNAAITRTTYPWAEPDAQPPGRGMPTLVAFALGALSVPIVAALAYVVVRALRPGAAAGTGSDAEHDRYTPFAAADAPGHPHQSHTHSHHHAGAEVLLTGAHPHPPGRQAGVADAGAPEGHV